jgi:ribonuclease P protein component
MAGNGPIRLCFVRLDQKMPLSAQSFPRDQRLSGKNAFTAVYTVGTKQSRGPLVAYSKPNALTHYRWGLSVSRRVGTAVRRNRVKRLLRDSIRLLRAGFPKSSPAPYDIILVVRPHTPLKLEEYQTILSALVARTHDHWQKLPPKIG